MTEKTEPAKADEKKAAEEKTKAEEKASKASKAPKGAAEADEKTPPKKALAPGLVYVRAQVHYDGKNPGELFVTTKAVAELELRRPVPRLALEP